MLRIIDRVSFAIIGALTLALVALLAGLVNAVPLDPNGPPAPTMKTLDEIPGSWSRTLPADDGYVGEERPVGCDSTRFQCVFGDNAVLDRETGLVWERSPSGSPANWVVAQLVCGQLLTGNRGGWRLPSKGEMTSLIDSTAAIAPYLPDGHPFSGVQADSAYWTSTSNGPDHAITVTFDLSSGVDTKATGSHLYWCVRGGAGYDDR